MVVALHGLGVFGKGGQDKDKERKKEDGRPVGDRYYLYGDEAEDTEAWIEVWMCLCVCVGGRVLVGVGCACACACVDVCGRPRMEGTCGP